MFYTYAHSTPSGRVFYVGKGTGDRGYSKSDRSIAWREVVRRAQGYAVAILAQWDTAEEAFEHERFLIACFRDLGTERVNQTSGGKGPYDYCVSPQVRERKSAQMRGYKHRQVVCPVCGVCGGEPSMKRWHFEKCTGPKLFRARVTSEGRRVFIGNFATKEAADAAVAAVKGSV